MYPSPVMFIAGPEAGPAVVRWTWDGPVHAFLVFCARVPVPPERTEAFYAGEFGPDIRRLRLDPNARALVDERPPPGSSYLVLAANASGDLRSVRFDVGGEILNVAPDEARVAATPSASPYQDLPELIYRDDDAQARVMSRTMAASLSARHGHSEGEGT